MALRNGFLNHPSLGRRPESDDIGIPMDSPDSEEAFKTSEKIQHISGHSNYMKHLVSEKKNIQTLQTHEAVIFSKPVSTHQVRKSSKHPTPSSNQSSLNLVPQPSKVIG